MPEIPKAYEPRSVEDKWNDFWRENGCFTADPALVSARRPAYSIVIPPPNVTGMLHMGHVLNNTIQDILSRKARMDGKEVLWLPGTDHAGIATQVQVEKHLRKEERKTKHDLGREEFLKRVWLWKEKHGNLIVGQLKKLGCSCDWTRERFTMDPDYSRCVQMVFVELFKKGLIYRGQRMVNWCPATQTALSDEEVEMKPQKGFMYHFRVQVAEEPETFLTIATTRPETIPGDTAVAVHPDDPRYARLIGKHVVRPLPVELPPAQKLIPIVGDKHVDFKFGSGVLKVTPAHDKADFEIGLRHKLAAVDIMNPDGTMNNLAGESLAGLDRFEARSVAIERLKQLGLLHKEEPYENNIGFSERADVPIEPRLSEQWFLKYPAVEQSRACVEQQGGSGQSQDAPADSPEGTGRGLESKSISAVTAAASPVSAGGPDAPRARMRFHPQRWAKVYDHWLSNIQDWCISRQLWWGHRVPVWMRTGNGEDLRPFLLQDAELFRTNNCSIKVFTTDGNELQQNDIPVLPPKDSFTVFLAGVFDDKQEKRLRDSGFVQDPDVLDTWFSSWLWPFATMGWPEQTETLKKFYPTTDLVTGPDIIFFWVARMIMAGYEFMGELPFRNVYFTGIIRDKQGRKMSKSLGNSPDPLALIATYGADALRFGTMRSAPLGQDVLFDEKDVELGRNFCNKLWNACRYRQLAAPTASLAAPGSELPSRVYEIQGEIQPSLLTMDDKWILLKLDAAIRDVTRALNEYKFTEATAALHRFFWSEYCDWHLEASKATLRTAEESKPEDAGAADAKANTLAVLDFVLSHALRLFHPFIPFITEDLWHGMGYATGMPDDQGGKTIMNAPWPKPLDADVKAHFGLDQGCLEMTDAKYELITQGRNLRRAGNIQAAKKVRYVFKPAQPLTAHDAEVIKLLLNASTLEINGDYQPPKGTPAVQSKLGDLFLPLEGLVDTAAEKIRLGKELEKINAEIAKVAQKLANPNFTQKVPAAVLAEHEQRLKDWQSKLDHTQSLLDGLG